MGIFDKSIPAFVSPSIDIGMLLLTGAGVVLFGPTNRGPSGCYGGREIDVGTYLQKLLPKC